LAALRNRAPEAANEMNEDLNPLEVPADREDKRTADEDVSFGDGNQIVDENGFGGNIGGDIFNTSIHGENQPDHKKSKKNDYDLEEEKGGENNFGFGDQNAMIINFNQLL